RHPAAESEQEHEVDGEPGHPADQTGEVEAPELDHRRVAADGCHDAAIAISEGCRLPSQEVSRDRAGRRLPLLLGHPRQLWKGGPVSAWDLREVADDIHLAMTG